MPHRIDKCREFGPRWSASREREQIALDMRKSGSSFREIGEALGITEMGASKAVRRALKRINDGIAENVEEVRRLEVERLDRMLLAMDQKVAKGDLGAIETALKLSKRRSELLGCDAPKKMDVDVQVGIRQYEGVEVDKV